MLGLRQLLDCLSVCQSCNRSRTFVNWSSCHNSSSQSAINSGAGHKSCGVLWTFEQTFSTVWDICTSCKLRRQRCKEHTEREGEREGERETRSAACDVQRQQLRDIKQNLKGFAPQNGNWQWATGRGMQPDVASGQKGNKAEELQASLLLLLLLSRCFSAFLLFDHFSNVSGPCTGR